MHTDYLASLQRDINLSERSVQSLQFQLENRGNEETPRLLWPPGVQDEKLPKASHASPQEHRPPQDYGIPFQVPAMARGLGGLPRLLLSLSSLLDRFLEQPLACKYSPDTGERLPVLMQGE